MSRFPFILRTVCAAALVATPVLCWTDDESGEPNAAGAVADAEAAIQQQFKEQIQPLLNEYCLRCHSVDEMKSGIRVDQLDGALAERNLRLWEGVREQIADEVMPPEDEPQPSQEQRRLLIDWIDEALGVARARDREKNGSVRRLSVAQYRNTLQDLLGLEEDVTSILPADGVSKEGFVNNGESGQLSPLLVEAYFEIAERALDLCIVDKNSKPEIQNFRVDLGRAVNPKHCPDELILGAFSRLLGNEDFLVTQLTPQKPFDFEPRMMRTEYRFIEGYQGNDTVRGWREFDSIYHAVFACVRGTDGYPKGLAYETVPEGLLLRPAIPSNEIFNDESTYGPKANFKISLRELPDRGNFRVTVTAARYDDGLLLDAGAAAQGEPQDGGVSVTDLSQPQTIEIPREGVYQIDVYPAAQGDPKQLSLTLGEREFAGTLTQPAFLVLRLSAGELALSTNDDVELERLVLTPLAEEDDLRRRFETFERRAPHLGVHVGLRRDCGSTLAPVGEPQTVDSPELKAYVFEGAINDFPSPDVEEDNVNYLAGIREIGVRSEYTDGRDMPRLLIRSIEFEGPFYETWPPRTHRNIFIESENASDPPIYAREMIHSFATRAFRRPVENAELAPYIAVWEDSFAATGDFSASVKDALLVVLTSPQFLFLIESSESPEPELIGPYELASKLSYFLWNSPPDDELLQLAAADKLHGRLEAQVSRMIGDPRFDRFADQFTSQWLSLDKFDVLSIDRERYPRLTRDTKAQLRAEPKHYLRYLIRENLPLKTFIESDFVVANEVVASYYELGDRCESGFTFVRVPVESDHLGGVLSQAAILAGLSDGREANPVKRGAWVARKIIAEPPDDPPPNVPALPEDDGAELTLREKLERHRDQEGCAKCHAGIDPWGLPFEQYDAGGLFRDDPDVDARSILPDQTQVDDARELKHYLANERIDQVAFSVLKHLSTYAVGRSLTYNEIEALKEDGLELKDDGYRMQDMVRFVVNSGLFLEK